MSEFRDRIDALSNDKRELLDLLLQQSQSTVKTASVVPRNEIEEQLLAIWTDILGVNDMGVEDHFIALGGDSIRAIQISARARKTGLSFSADQIFKSGTIARLGEVVKFTQPGSNLIDTRETAMDTRDRSQVSFGEHRLWLQHQLKPDMPIYNTFAGLRIEGPLSEQVLQRAVEEIVRRHEILRAVYKEVDGQVCRLIKNTTAVDLRKIELDDSNSITRDEQIRNQMDIETQKPFDLEAGPLFRCLQLRLGVNVHLIVITAHHIIFDAWSMKLVIYELGRLYEAYSYGFESPLPELEISYANFACWQKERYLSGDLKEQLAYWRNKLHGVPAVHSLPLSHIRPEKRSFRGSVVYFDLPGESSVAIKQYSHNKCVTLNVALLSAYYLLLFLVSDETDLVVGTPVLGRPTEESQKVVGFFLNTLVLRLSMEGNPRVEEVVGRVDQMTLEAFHNQELPFEKLLLDLEVAGSPAYGPLFQLWFVFQEATMAEMRARDLSLKLVNLDRVVSLFDLSLSLQESENGLQGWVEYNTDIFDSAFAKKLINQYQLIIDMMPAYSDQPMDVLLDAVREKELSEEKSMRLERRRRLSEFRRT